SDYAHLAINGGAKIVGGCCGTSFEHLAAMRKALDTHTPGPRPTVETIIETIGPMRNKLSAHADNTPKRERRGRRG
ncbi:MAG: homocysteine S-methyltransferase family protein, partial [Phyllobacterium sp.]